MQRIRVASFNIHGGRPAIGWVNLEATADVLRELDADFVGLQEVHRYMPPPYVFQDQPRRLARLLEGHVVFRRSLGLGPVGYGNAVLSRWKPGRVRRIRLPGGFEPRSLLDTRYELDGGRFHFMTTHLGLRQEERMQEVRAISRYLSKIEAPVVLVGDLNAFPDSPEVQVLIGCGLTDCSSGDIRTFPWDTPKHKIDYILSSRHFGLAACHVVETAVSDHLPLVADLVLE